MENLQRQQAARLRQAEKELQSQMQHQALLRQYQAAVRLAPGLSPALPHSLTPALAPALAPGLSLGLRVDSRGSSEERDAEDTDENELMEEELERYQAQSASHNRDPVLSRAPPGFGQSRPVRPESPPQNQNHEWTYEEQFKQVGPCHSHS